MAREEEKKEGVVVVAAAHPTAERERWAHKHTPLFTTKVNNSSAIAVSGDTGIDNKVKHIAIRYHFH
jgi:hypothetical protein